VAVVTALSGLAAGVQAVLFPTAMQTVIPPQVLVRVTSIVLLASEAGQPIGYALAGPAGTAFGAHTVPAAGELGMLIASSAFPVLRPLRTEIRRPSFVTDVRDSNR